MPHAADVRVREALLEGAGYGGAAVGAPLADYCRDQARRAAPQRRARNGTPWHAQPVTLRRCPPQGISHLVVGSRGAGALKRALLSLLGLGSVSDYLVHHAPCAVTVVPTPPA
jgi:hypothetical protein